MVRPVSSGKWKAPPVSCQPFISSLYAVILVICGVNIKGQAALSAWHMAPSCVREGGPLLSFLLPAWGKFLESLDD